ncbi:hypothetical protein BV22DRAFT_1126074 [Leucogyrophana mollusca]|uniref:Uncharacterized protein n=1 Tax=Leucogyrophana mollusca TaxID=85980 RepID=A0ACB8BTM0_9AGAM|nr:hypothetical protein BV22DRAFT_1126074 [Leucogyrophana mollusca]
MVALPPLGRMSLIAIWFETLLYGANVILFVTCLWVLTSHVQKISIPLLASTLLLFSLCTAHVSLSLVQVLQAYTDLEVMAAGGPDLYFAVESNAIYSAKNMLYNFAVFSQDILLIWRLYMVWARNWKICIVPIIMECIHIGTILVAAVLLTEPATDVFSHSVQAWGLSGWAMDVAVNTLVTFGIAYRLWCAEKQSVNTNGKQASYKTAMFTVLESGAIFATATIILFALDVSGNVAGNVGISPVSQLAATTPMLIIARVGVLSAAKRVHDSNSHPSRGSTVTAPRTSRPSKRIEVSIQHDVDRVYPLKDFNPEKTSPTSLEEGKVPPYNAPF